VNRCCAWKTALAAGRGSALRRFRPEREQHPTGTQLAIGAAVLEVTAQPHTGCKKFAERFVSNL